MNLCLPRGRMGEGIVRKFGIYTLLYLKWIINKDLLYNMELCSMLYGSLDGRGVWGRMDTCIDGWVSWMFIWNYHNIVNHLYPSTRWKAKKKSRTTQSHNWDHNTHPAMQLLLFFFYFLIYCLWHLVFLAVLGLSLAVASGSDSSYRTRASHCSGFSYCGTLA